MPNTGKTKNDKNAKWEEARKRFRLSHEHVRMDKALGMNPAKLGKLANNKQEPWKMPLPDFIEHCYQKHFEKPAKKKQAVSAGDKVSEQTGHDAGGVD